MPDPREPAPSTVPSATHTPDLLSQPLPRWEWSIGFFVLVCVVAGWGLADQGLLTDAELPAWDRARAANGAALDGLLRQPWLPERLRALGLAAFGPELGLRLPGLIATGASAGAVVWLGQRLFAQRAQALIAGMFYLAFLVVGSQARFAAGQALLEACIALCLVGALVAGDSRYRRSTRALAALVGLLCLAGAISCGGIVLGGALPLFVLALAGPTGVPIRLRSTAIVAGSACLACGIWLAHGQGEGYIPLLAGAKSQALTDNPLRRELTATVEAFGRRCFPFAVPMMLGMLLSRAAAWPARWIALGLIAGTAWSALYGPSDLGLAVPAALACAASIEALLNPERGVGIRRVALLLAVGGMWVAAKDAERKPSRVASPTHRYTREATFPSDAIQAADDLAKLARYAWLAWIAAYLLAHAHGGPRGTQRERAQRLALGLVAAMLAHQAWLSLHALPRRSAAHLSLREVFARHQAGVQAGVLPPELALHRVRDRGIEVYGPPEEQRASVSTRRGVRDWLSADAPRVALVRKSDHPGLHQMHREQGWPLHVIDWAHHDLKLLANFEAPGFEIVDPLAGIVVDQVPELEHETFVRFDQHLEVVSWQIEGDVRRGGEVTVTLAIKVLRPLSAGAEIYVRMQQGRMSKINLDPHRPLGGLYPANNWRRGDVIIDRVTFKIPRVNTVPGPHELFVGVRRNKKQNLEISVPEGRKGEFGVSLRGRTGREFANLGTIDL